MNTVAIDAMDDYTVTSNSFAGLPDVLDRFATALSAVTGMPKTLLFGEQTKGLSNGGDGDLQNWYAQIKQWQNTKLKNPLDRIVTMLAKSLNIPDQNYLIEFEPLYVPSEKEEAETEKLEAEAKKIKADTAAVYVTAGALDPSELRQSLIDDGDYIMDGSIQIVQGEDDGLEA
jgi:phage-related protein (TIGR01555 family)